MNDWLISYNNYDPSQQRLRETIFTLANGYFATRGAHEDSASSDHYPGTYLGGLYNRISSTIMGKKLINEDLVNLPNWLALSFKIGEEDWFDISQVSIVDFREFLNLKKGLVCRRLKFKDKKDRIFTIHSTRFVSQHNPHLAGLSYSIWAENWEGELSFRSSIIGDVINEGVPRYRELNGRHLELLQKGSFNKNYLFMQTKTSSSHCEISQVIKTEVYIKSKKIFPQRRTLEEAKSIHQEFTLFIQKHQKIRINKILCLFTSKDKGIFENLYDAKKLIKNQMSFRQLLKNHLSSWNYLWYLSDITIDSTKETQKLLRLHLFHSLQTLSKHSVALDYGVQARGLHGEAYRGHVFWDELFILGFYNYLFPNITRAMLLYRYNRLDSARENAKKEGFRGAMFPWQSGSNGEEETQKYHLNPESMKWGPDHSHQQRHVNFAIVYNIYNYYQTSQDLEFLSEYGAEIIFEIARFISSLVRFNSNKKRYEIIEVMGPDEYHESYPENQNSGINNNCYTNIMAVWVLQKALELTKILNPHKMQYYRETLDLNAEELRLWSDISFKMYVPFDKGILSQFEHYENLKEFEWINYQQKYGRIERLDRILKAENKDPNCYKIAKQPDVLMLFYLFEEEEIAKILNHLGYAYSEQLKINTINYYLERTSHGSTLSKISFASILAEHDPETTKKLFHEALKSDIEDTQGGTTEEGIHFGVMVGSLMIILKKFAGLRINKGIINLSPSLPQWIQRLKFKFRVGKNLYQVEILSEVFHISLLEKNEESALIQSNNKTISLSEHNSISVYYKTEFMEKMEPTIQG